MFVLYPVLLGLMYRSPDVVLFPAIILLVFLLSIPNAYVFFGSFPGQLRAFAAGSNLPLIAFFAYWLIISLETGLAEPDVSYVTGGLPTLASLDMFMWAFGAILVSPLLGTLNLLAYLIFFRANT